MDDFRCGFKTQFSLRDRFKLLFGAPLRGTVWQRGERYDEWTVKVEVGAEGPSHVSADAICCARVVPDDCDGQGGE